MSLGGEDKIVSVRFNPYEKEELDYVVKNYSMWYKLPVATVLKNFVLSAYIDLKSKESKNK